MPNTEKKHSFDYIDFDFLYLHHTIDFEMKCSASNCARFFFDLHVKKLLTFFFSNQLNYLARFLESFFKKKIIRNRKNFTDYTKSNAFAVADLKNNAYNAITLRRCSTKIYL